MSSTIETSDNREYFKKSAYNRFFDFYTQYIPKHLSKWGTPDENGIQMDWTNSFEGYTSVIDFMVDDAVRRIMERPEDKVVQFHLKALKNAIDLWTPEWDKEFAIYAISTFHSFDAPQTSDAYMTLWTMGYIENEETKTQVQSNKVLNSMSWVHKKPLDEALKTLKPLSYLFAEGSLNGLKMALGGGNIYDMKGCIRPSKENKSKLLFLIFNLIKKGCVEPSDNMDEAIRVLTDTGGSYRKVKYTIAKEYYAPKLAEENLILTLIDALIQ